MGSKGNYDRKDRLYSQAKREGYRSRAAYKLVELDKKYKLILSGMRVLDLGAWPGGWCQVAASLVGPTGRVVGVDLVEIEALDYPQVTLLCGDMREESTVQSVASALGGKADVVLSDMSSKLTGIREQDDAAAAAILETALGVAKECLKKGGSFVCKVFKGNDCETSIKSVKKHFEKLVRAELDSSRDTSNEFYIIGFSFK